MTDPLGLISNAASQRADLPISRQQPGSGENGDFRTLLEQELAEVNKLQEDARVAVEDFVTGKRDDMESVILATQKADTAFKMLLQVRNKVMDAMEEVKQIRV